MSNNLFKRNKLILQNTIKVKLKLKNELKIKIKI